MGKALDGVRILDFTHVQSGPTCTQLLAWFGADVIKVEKAGGGDITREQLRDIPDVDSLYFTMLNHNKRSVTLDTKSESGKQVLEKLVKHCDVLVENFAPGALDRMGFTWEKIQQLNPRMIVASVKGFGPGPYEECKVYENVAQCAGGAASTTGFDDGPPLVTGAQIGSILHTGHHPVFQHWCVRTSMAYYRHFILPVRSSRGFASTARNKIALFGLAFASAAPQSGLTTLQTVSRRIIMQKAHRHP